MGWMGYTIGTGVTTAQKFAQRLNTFLPRPFAFKVSRVIYKFYKFSVSGSLIVQEIFLKNLSFGLSSVHAHLD